MGGPGSGRGGLSRETVREVQHLLKRGWTAERVARQLEIGATTVKKIRAGEHFLQLQMDIEAYERCPGCGGLLAVKPCVLCELRKAGL